MDAITRIDADARFNDARSRATVIVFGLIPLLIGVGSIVSNQLVSRREIDGIFWLAVGFIVLSIALFSWSPTKHRRNPRVHAHIDVGPDSIVWGRGDHVFRTWHKDDGDVVWVRRTHSIVHSGRDLQIGDDRRPLPGPDFDQFSIEQLRGAVLAHGWAWRFEDDPPIRRD